MQRCLFALLRLPTLVSTVLFALAGCAQPQRPCPRPPRAQAPALESARVLAYGQVRIAVTFDDLPGAGQLRADYPRSRIADQLVATLRAHGVPTPVGFVNGALVSDDDARRALASWIGAGFPLGNHTFSHQGARALGATAFLADVAQNHAFLLGLTGAVAPRWFRYPYLERGASPEERIAITRGLAAQGYRVANVSIDFADWLFEAPHARCSARADEAALKGLREAYLTQASAALFWSVETSQRLFGRTLPQVLLLHALTPTAQNLDALLGAYEAQGAVWVTLDEVMRDPAYDEPPDRDHGDTTTLVEAIAQSHSDLRSLVPRPSALLELVCR